MGTSAVTHHGYFPAGDKVYLLSAYRKPGTVKIKGRTGLLMKPEYFLVKPDALLQVLHMQGNMIYGFYRKGQVLQGLISFIREPGLGAVEKHDIPAHL